MLNHRPVVSVPNPFLPIWQTSFNPTKVTQTFPILTSVSPFFPHHNRHVLFLHCQHLGLAVTLPAARSQETLDLRVEREVDVVPAAKHESFTHRSHPLTRSPLIDSVLAAPQLLFLSFLLVFDSTCHICSSRLSSDPRAMLSHAPSSSHSPSDPCGSLTGTVTHPSQWLLLSVHLAAGPGRWVPSLNLSFLASLPVTQCPNHSHHWPSTYILPGRARTFYSQSRHDRIPGPHELDLCYSVAP